MSNERELLQRILDTDPKFLGGRFIAEIQDLLAQPEHIPDVGNMVKQEPVAWMYDHHIEVGYDKYTEFNIVETCARNLESENCINVRPLYLAPPTREPLSDERLEFLVDKYHGYPKTLGRAVEKAHGIGVDDE